MMDALLDVAEGGSTIAADLKTFETQARQLQGLTNGQGEDWVKAQELGRQIDPTNPLYTEGGEYAIVAKTIAKTRKPVSTVAP